MDPGVDQFYVGLFSNESLSMYRDNTLSTFTNKLARAIQVDENWVVGLTAISFPKYEKFQRMVMAKKNDNNDDEYDVETFSPITVNDAPSPKKRRRQREYRKMQQKEESIVIKVSPTENIVLTESDIKKLTYKASNLNCGILLQTLAEKIEPKPDKSDQIAVLRAEMLKRNIKIELFSVMKNNTWGLDDTPVKLRRHNDEYFVHVYQGSKKSANIILKYQKYGSLVEFIKFILSQLPTERRTPEKLAPLLNMFYDSYDLLDEKVQIVQTKNKVNLLVPFNEYGASTGLFTESILNENPMR